MASAARLLRELAVAGLCLTAAGVVAGARDLTASYVAGREQFGRPLAEFQAVAHADRRRLHRLADHRRSPPTTPPGGSPRASTPTTTSPSRRTGLRPRRPRRCAPATTCTAAWASTRPTRCTATSRWVTDLAHALGRRAPPTSAVEDPTAQEPRAHRRAARAQGRAARLLRRPGHATRTSREMASDRHGETYQRIVRQMGDGRLDGRRLARGVRRPRARRDRADRSSPTRPQRADVHLPAVTLQTVGPTLHPLRHREAEGPVPQADPRGRRALRDRLHRARRRHRPRLAAHHRASAATATTTSSTARSSGPPAATRPTTSGSRCAPTPTPPSTRASRS